VPVRVGEKSIGILEAFSAQPNAFSEADSRALQRLAETVLAALNRAARAEDLPTLDPPKAADRFAPTPGSVLFAAPEEEKKTETAEGKQSGVSLPRSHLIILILAAISISSVLGYSMAPWIQAKLEERAHSQPQTVLASSPAPKSDVVPTPAVETATIEQLRQMAENGNPVAENALGVRYFLGDAVPRDEKEAFRWFKSAAGHGNVKAQYKLGLLYWRGDPVVPKDTSEAYFWTVLARAGGEESSKDVAGAIAAQLSRPQLTAVEQRANAWLHQQPTAKPEAGH